MKKTPKDILCQEKSKAIEDYAWWIIENYLIDEFSPSSCITADCASIMEILDPEANIQPKLTQEDREWFEKLLDFVYENEAEIVQKISNLKIEMRMWYYL